MNTRRLSFLTFLFISTATAQSRLVPLEPVTGLQLHNVRAEAVTYKDRRAIRITDTAADNTPDGNRFAILSGTNFRNGMIEVDLAGDTQPGAGPEFRGFTGLAFRASPDGASYECFYLRPKNGRSLDQTQRNHSVQYISNPDFPWQRLRQETPGKYESYVDLVPGEWTKVKIQVQGAHASLYVNGASQPVLLVDSLKHGMSQGTLALWVGPKTVAHFANLRVTPD